jgi:anti-anti-sigma factor
MDAGREARGVRLRLLAERAELTVLAEVDIASEPALHEALDRALTEGAKDIVFDFCGSAYVGGPAVRLALTALERVRTRGGKVTVRGDRHVLRLFRVTGVDNWFTLEGCA